LIETYHLSKFYSRGVYALRDLSLTIDKGEFIFLTGPSGWTQAGRGPVPTCSRLEIVDGFAPGCMAITIVLRQ